MTAEVCVMNRIGVALAADSAVTIGDGWKIHTSADKMFVLTEDDPVGIMIFGKADLDGVPWETIIKTYRSQTRGEHLPTVEAHAKRFIDFLEKSISQFFSEALQREAAEVISLQFFRWMQNAVAEKIEERLSKHRQQQSYSKIISLIKAIIKKQRESIRKPENTYDNISDAALRPRLKELYGKAVGEKCTKVFGDLADNIKKDFCELYLDFLIYQCDELPRSGVVIAGFGTEEQFPSIIELSIQAILADTLLYHKENHFSMADAEEHTNYVIPFAQQEMVHAFMRGIDPEFRKFVNDTINKAILTLYKEIKKGSASNQEFLNELQQYEVPIEKALERLMVELDDYERKQFRSPVMRTIATLPKDELALTAEMLVTLTKFKRQLNSEQLETVGGPIDVAIITKGDGFIWIKRKHYFDASLNPRFLARYGRVKEWKNNRDKDSK